jgi:hypothetical protein
MNQKRGRFFVITISILLFGVLVAVFVASLPESGFGGNAAVAPNLSGLATALTTNAAAPRSAILNSNQTANAVGSRPVVGAREFDLVINPYAAGLREPGRAKRAWESDFLQRQQNVSEGVPIEFELTGGVMASGVIKLVQRDGAGITYLSGELTAPEAGKFFFLRPPVGGRAGSAVGVIEFPTSKTAYRIEPTGESGAPELWQRRLDEVICLSMLPVDEAALTETFEAPPLRPDLVPEYVPAYNSNIVSLQSLPGARGVVLLDFFGGYTPTWGGVQYSAPNIGNTAIRDVWKRIAEDYMPLNINVTTDHKVFEAAPEGSRQRCVFAPDAPTAAGVAYFGSWNWSGDTVCWAKYTTGKSAAEVGSHEVGHTVGLAHQTQDPPGTEFNEYYGGHAGAGNTGWSPIMGVGYYQPVTTWAKGEYLYAAELQDELAVMITFNDVDYRADDTGSTFATARHLEIADNLTVSGEGVIETSGDADAFPFSTTGGFANLTASVVGDWANLALMAELQDAGGVTIASNNPQSALSVSIATTLAAGDYTFKITGAGRNSALTNGFSDYGSLGYYAISGSVTGARKPSRFTVAERSPNGTLVGTITSTNANALTYVITAGNSNNAFALDNNGVLTVANSAALLYPNLAYGTQLTVQFELFVDIIDAVDPLQTEMHRRVVVQVLDLPEAAAQLLHRWSFNNGADSVGGATAVAVGSASFAGGKLQIPGGAARANCATVNLNNTLATNISLTVEGWFTMNSLQNWSKLWMFGRPNGGNEPGLAYMEFTPRAGADGNVPSMSVNTGGRSFESNTRTAGNPALLTTGVEYHAVCVYDSGANLMSLYLNGQLVDSAALVEANLTQLAATEAYFGAAVNYGDANLNGAINEMRIYNGPVSPLQVALNHAAGPDNVITNPGALLALRLVVANTNMVSLSSQPVTVYADYANVTNVNVTMAGATCSSGNSNIVSTTVPGLIRAIVPGTTLLTASFGGSNVSRTITVTNTPMVLAHRWSFNNGTDSIGGVNASLLGTASFSGGKLVLPGGGARSNCASINIAGTLNTTVDLTVETWFTITNQQDWAKLWMFGRRAEGAGEPWLSYVEFSPRAGVAGNVPSLAFNPISGGEASSRGDANPALLTTGVTYYAVASYNSASNLMSLYLNGVLVDNAAMGNGNITQLNPDTGYLGAAVHYDDPCFNGAIDEMRIWKGVLSAGQIAFNANAGPNTLVTNAGPLTGLRFVVATNTMPRGTTQPSTVYADYANYPNLNVTSSGVAYSSSSPAIVAVNSSGVLSAVGAGTATVTASFGGSNVTQTIAVIGATVLAHRWSFNDGTDSVGGANAALVGSAFYSGGKLNIPGGAARANAATVNINATLAAKPSLTIEGWFTMNTLQGWAKVWMFGRPNGGAQPGLAYVDFTPRRGDGTSVPSISLDTVTATEVNTSGGANPGILAAGFEYHAVAVYNAAGNTMSLYLNGALVDSASMNGGNITQIQATEAWFGAAVHWPDNNLNGAINEIRIWDGPLTASQIATNYAFGPNALPRPKLAVAANSGGLVITWPESFAGFTLETSPVLGVGAAWTPVLPPPVIAGGVYTVTLATTNPASFFRLVQ